MKKYVQSFGYIGFVILTFLGLTKAFTSYKNPFDIYENPLVWLALIGFVLVVVLKEVLNIVALQRAEELQREKDGITEALETPSSWLQELIKNWTKSKPIEEEQEIILDHNYDGIKELDNSLPPWWVYLFYVTILFAAVYLIRFHVFNGDTQAVEYEKAVAEAKLELEKFKESSPEEIIDATNVTLLTEASDLKRGRAVFNLNCASCHAQDGGGGIGPNLTDKHWILGGGIKNVFTTISQGGRSGKGMVPWNKTLKPKDIAKVASYVLSFQGTTPANPKAPEGDVWEEQE